MVFTVAQLSEYIAKRLYRDPFLSSVCVVGEATNFGMSSVGHAFFSLKDGENMLSCVAYDFAGAGYGDIVGDGALLKIFGRVMYYKKSGSVQLVMERAELQGTGDLFARFEQTRMKLAKEGLFLESRKRPLPAFPLHLGVVTSTSGAVMYDIINVATRRFEGVRITIYPVQVQGAVAAKQVCEGIEYFNHRRAVDVIIVARGGGSFEDLFAFNEEIVARAVYHSEIPVISAVGHETDYTLCDMAADLRAPTPSAAAELAVPEKHAIREYIDRCREDIRLALRSRLQGCGRDLEAQQRSLRAAPLSRRLEQLQLQISAECAMMGSAMHAKLERCTLVMEKYESTLEGLNPRGVLQRGYAIVHDVQGGVITSSKRAARDMEIEFVDGLVAVARKD
jgi:exodeoxyribonuclease VII large subunit